MLQVCGKGDGIFELAEPHKWGHIWWLAMMLTNVVKDYISNLDMVVVYVLPGGFIMEVEMHIGVMEPTKKVIIAMSKIVSGLLSLLL